MSGLHVLYDKKATKERDWAETPDRDKPGRLREVYWAHRADLKLGPKSFMKLTMGWRTDRSAIGRGRDDPGDGFVYLVGMTAQPKDRLVWLEVTEVFTTVPAAQIEGAMRALNGIPGKDPVDLDEFLKQLPGGRPCRADQRRAADKVIAQIERKLAKSSYRELLERYGYGTLVVGLPLWFATPPDNPFRAENALDDFHTRTSLGLEEVERRILRRRDCPFRNVIVRWDTTLQAKRAWLDATSVVYERAANARLETPLSPSTSRILLEETKKSISAIAVPESEAPSFRFWIDAKTRKTSSGNGPYPEIVETVRDVVRDSDDKSRMNRLTEMLRRGVVSGLGRLLFLLRFRRTEGLKKWITGKRSVSYAWKVQAARRRARRFYRESRQRSRVLHAGPSQYPSQAQRQSQVPPDAPR